MPPGRPKEFCTQDALSRALDVFWRNGYEHTSIADLVDAMGVGRQSLYDTFGDKRKLYLAALDRYATEQTQHTTDILAGSPPKGERVREVLRLWATAHQQPSCKGCLLTNSFAEFGPDDPEVKALRDRHLLILEDHFADALAQAADEGSLRADIDPRSLARMLITMAQGLALAGKGGDPDRIADAADALERLIT